MQEERKMILKMIEDGKISAEEGLQLLNALKDDKGDTNTSQKNENKSTTFKSTKGPHSAQEPMNESAKKKETDQFMSRNVNWDAGGYRRAEEKMTSFAGKFSDFIEEAVQKIKEFDLDFNFGNSVEVEHIFQHRNATVKNVDIHIENGSITFRPWDENDIRIECQVKVYKVKDSDEARRVFMDEVAFNFSNEKLRFHAPKKSMKVNTVIYVPKHAIEKINLYAFNGKISGEDLNINDIEMKTVNGRIGFEHVVAKQVNVETVSGAIAISRLEADRCDVKSVTGTVTIDTKYGDLDVESISGTVHYTLLDTANARAYIKTTTGSVYIRVPEDVKAEGDLKTTVGSINCHLPQMSVIEEKKEFANNKMSFIANKHQETKFYIGAEATTGAITIKN